MSRIAVLYEDQLQPGTEPRDFGPHQLLVSCLHDEGLADQTTLFQGRPQILQRLHPFVVKGNGNLKRTCQAPDRALQSFAQRVAIFDSDRLRQLLGAAYPAPACTLAIRRALGEPQSPDGVRAGAPHVVLLVDNIESLLRACDAQWSGKPTPLERDRLLRPFWTTSDRSPRDTLRQRVPSWDYLVRHVAGLLRRS